MIRDKKAKPVRQRYMKLYFVGDGERDDEPNSEQMRKVRR